MIIKIKTRKRASFRQLINYITHDTERVPDSRIILHNLAYGSTDDWVGWFKYNETFRQRKRKNSVILTHEILSFHPGDTPYLNVEIIEDIARKYIELRNPNGIYLGTIHLAKDHYHVHFCVSGVEYRSGLAMRMSKDEVKHLKQELQHYQKTKYPQLTHSIVPHGKSKDLQLSDREYFRKHSSGEPSTREKLSLVVSDVFDRAKDIDAFLGELASQGLEPYYRQEKPMGIWFNNRKYRFTKLGLEKPSLEKLIQRSISDTRSR